MRFFLLLLVLCVSDDLPANAAEVAIPVLFDFGTGESPTAATSMRVTGTTQYDPATGYGWLSSNQLGFDRSEPLPELKHGGNPMRPDLLYHHHATSLNRDGVASENDLQFRMDVTPGSYRVQVWLGDLHQPLESLAVECNGKTIATGISAKHIIGRSRPESTGFYRLVPFDVDANAGSIELRFYGDETQYQKNIESYRTRFPNDELTGSYLGGAWKPHAPLKFDPTSPFQRNSVLAIRVTRPGRRVFAFDEAGALHAVGSELFRQSAFVAALNSRKFSQAESLLDVDAVSGAAKLQGFLALLGHPDVEGEDEARVLRKTQQTLESLLRSQTPDVATIEAAESLDVFRKARLRFLHRGNAEEGHFQENRKVVSMMRLIPVGDLLYDKSLVYQGRALQMLDPHRWVYPSGDAQRVWKTLAAVFPDNRYARYYLTDEWSPDDVWHIGSPTSPDTNSRAPEWAVAQREAWHLLLEVCEYWADNKQQDDGGIGGGWGDDVELVFLFGMMGFISEGASEKSIQLAQRLIDGLWEYGGIDQEAGFYRGVLDAEHSAEWTGDTLPLMLLLAWDDPIWHQRAMQTAALMRHHWMDYNERGDLHFRSNFLGSIGVGNADQANDSYINIRAALPAMAAYQYNRNPHVAKLFVEWADAWVNDAMRTDRGKPRGVFPAEVGFPNGQLGGVNSPAWYQAAHPPGTVNYDWTRGNYTFYLVDLMLLAREITGDDKYLEPFRLQKGLVDQYRRERLAEPVPGSDMWAAKLLNDGAPRGRRPFDEIWLRIQNAIDKTEPDKLPVLSDKGDVLTRMDNVTKQVKRMWPVLTTEASATDRVGFRGIADPFLVMTGASTAVMKPSVTYSGVGREFAAFVKHADDRRLTVVMYNFADRDVDAGITPWILGVGGSYRIRSGIDSNGDDKPDQGIWEQAFGVDRRGQRVTFKLPSRETTIVEVRQTEAGNRPAVMADLAVVPSEITYSLWTRDLSATVHNIGSAPASKVRVTFYESDPAATNDRQQVRRKIGEAVIPRLSWPIDLTAKTQTVAVPYTPTKSPVAIAVVVDEFDKIEELSESNNLAIRDLVLDLDEVRAPRNRLGEIGGDVSGEIRRGLR